MPIEEHGSFIRPPIAVSLWRYMDIAKFMDLLSSRRLWLSNAEFLAREDPYEGILNAVLFPHRVWKSIASLPKDLREFVLAKFTKTPEVTPEMAFSRWMSWEEQICLMMEATRRELYVNCWHADNHESVAMWKIYSSMGAGVAVLSNGARIEQSVNSVEEHLYLGKIRYRGPNEVRVGVGNMFDTILVKRLSYKYEQEVRLVFCDTSVSHDALDGATWNAETMRYENLKKDERPVVAGRHIECDIHTLIERVIVSPFSPSWCVSMIEAVRDQLGFKFPVQRSKLFDAPEVAQ
jgi:hypothetical protein